MLYHSKTMSQRQRHLLVSLLLCTPLYCASVNEAEPHRQLSWLPERLPTPDQESCHNNNASLRFCDPDNVLLASDIDKLATSLQDDPLRKIKLHKNCKLDKTSSQEQNDTLEVQYAVVVISKMDLESSGASGSSLSRSLDHPEKAAEIFARQVHDSWGVGYGSSCGGSGILLFLSISDRTIYFSRGAALESVLTDRRLDKTIDDMKSYLIESHYAEAILHAIYQLDQYLLLGEPGWKEKATDYFEDYFTYFVLCIIFFVFGISAYQEQKKRREYATVSSHLNELDRARAEALQGRFQATSCPICLENFQNTDSTGERDDNATDTSSSETVKLTRKGSDGLPLKLLRCGHVFDETCWADWINSGHHGKVDKCPVCQQDVGTSVVNETPTTNPSGPTARNSTRSDDWIRVTNNDDVVHLQNNEYRNRALSQYMHDRNFRLMRLASRYPQYIRPHQVQTWSQVGYDGSLARDPSFVNTDPARQVVSSNGSSSSSSFGRSGGGSSGFGGGFSGGGRGGRW